MSIFAPLKFQLHILLRSKRFRYAALICLIGMTIVHLQELSQFSSFDHSELPSAAIGWMANCENVDTAFWGYLVIFVLPVLACILHGDILLSDIKKNRLSSIISRSSRSAYMLSSALLVFLSAFFLVFIFEIISQLIAFLVFPLRADLDTYQVSCIDSAAELAAWQNYVEKFPFGCLALAEPYLFNLAYVLYNAYYIASLALVSFTVSVYLRKSRLFVLVLPIMFMLFICQLLPAYLNPIPNLLISFSSREYLSLFSMLAVPTGCLAICIAAIMLHEKVLKGDLL